MAAPGRSSSLTGGAGTLNNNFKTPYNRDDVPASSQEVLRLARTVVRAVERREGQEESAIFVQPEAELECSLRAHAFPPKDPNGAPPATIGRMQHDWNPNNFHEVREVDEREGGRMHGHVDQSGTDGVVLLNLGECDFFFDIGKGAGKGRCTAQRTKECWCAGNGRGNGHWVSAADAPAERYHSFDPRAPKWLLRDRMCATCAAGGQGEQCASCVRGTVHLHSGDLVVFSGCGAFHGVARVTNSTEGSLALPAGAPQLPKWARAYLRSGHRLSVQWRLTSREIAHKKVLKETGAVRQSALQHGIGSVPPGSPGFGEDPDLAAAITLSLAEGQPPHAAGAHSAQSTNHAEVIEVLSDSSEDEALVPLPTAGEKRPAHSLDVESMRQARLARFDV